MMSSKPKLTPEDWNEKCWKTNTIPFHRTEPNSALEKCYDQFILEETKSIFLPLCGKSVDLVWLAKKGLKVVGLEFSDIAVKAVFEESSQDYSVERIGMFDVYKSKEMNLTIYKGDFWDISPNICGTFDAIWDRGGFTVIVSEKRPAYAQLKKSVLNEGGRLLLFAPWYKSETYFDEPFPATEKEVHSYYDSQFADIKLVDEEILSMPQFGADRIESKTYLMN